MTRELGGTRRSGGADIVRDKKLQFWHLLLRAKVVSYAVLRRVIGGRHHQSLPTAIVMQPFSFCK